MDGVVFALRFLHSYHDISSGYMMQQNASICEQNGTFQYGRGFKRIADLKAYEKRGCRMEQAKKYLCVIKFLEICNTFVTHVLL